MAPAFIVIAIGLDPSRTLVISPGRALVRDPVRARAAGHVHRETRPDGQFVNRRITTVAASVVAGVIIALNLYLLAQTFGLA